MTKDIGIRADALGKKYRIGQEFKPYTALRDVLATSLHKFGRTTRDSLRGRRIVSRDAVEEFWALKDVSFEVERGDVLGIIGRNGAGKSTLLKILSRITEPSEGRVEITGRLASLLEVGTGFHPELTGRENIYLNGAILGMSRKEIAQKLEEIVSFSGVEKFLDMPVKRYSSGMYVRLAFSVAAHLEPDILIVDEVLAVGDVEFQKKCLGKLGDVAGQGRTVLFVSHNMAALAKLCTKGILLQGGRASEILPIAELVKSYLRSAQDESRELLHDRATRIIKSLRIKSADGVASKIFSVGDTVVFDIELAASTTIRAPRLSVGVCAPDGSRIATLHTHIQYPQHWSLNEATTLRAAWRNARLTEGEYNLDLSLWSDAGEEETLPGCETIRVIARDIYGTGRLPDPSFQGYIAPDVEWSAFRDQLSGANA